MNADAAGKKQTNIKINKVNFQMFFFYFSLLFFCPQDQLNMHFFVKFNKFVNLNRRICEFVI